MAETIGNDKPAVLNIAPDEGLVKGEMVPEGDLADYEMTVEHLVGNLGMPATMMEEFLNQIKTDPKFRESMDGKIAAMKNHVGKNPDKYGNMNQDALMGNVLEKSTVPKGGKGGY